MKKVLMVLTVFVLVFSISNCGSDSSVRTYGGPGSVYSITLDSGAGTFSLTQYDDARTTVEFSVNGTYTTLPTGFLKMLITEVVSGSGPVVGDAAYALEIPDFGFLLKPLGSGSTEIIPMVVSGSCPAENMLSNWIKTTNSSSANANDCNDDWFGTFSFNVSTGAASLPSQRCLVNNYATFTPGTTFSASGTCSDGLLELTSVGETVRIWLTQVGAAIVQVVNNSNGDQHIVGMPSNAITMTNLAGDYSGLMFSGDVASSDPDNAVRPMKITMNAAGTEFSGVFYNDIETGTLTSESGVVSGLTGNNPSSGFFTGTLTVGSNTGNMLCSAAENVASSSRDIIYCVAQDPGDNTKHFNILAVTQ